MIFFFPTAENNNIYHFGKWQHLGVRKHSRLKVSQIGTKVLWVLFAKCVSNIAHGWSSLSLVSRRLVGFICLGFDNLTFMCSLCRSDAVISSVRCTEKHFFACCVVTLTGFLSVTILIIWSPVMDFVTGWEGILVQGLCTLAIYPDCEPWTTLLRPHKATVRLFSSAQWTHRSWRTLTTRLRQKLHHKRIQMFFTAGQTSPMTSLIRAPICSWANWCTIQSKVVTLYWWQTIAKQASKQIRMLGERSIFISRTLQRTSVHVFVSYCCKFSCANSCMVGSMTFEFQFWIVWSHVRHRNDGPKNGCRDDVQPSQTQSSQLWAICWGKMYFQHLKLEWNSGLLEIVVNSCFQNRVFREIWEFALFFQIGAVKINNVPHDEIIGIVDDTLSCLVNHEQITCLLGQELWYCCQLFAFVMFVWRQVTWLEGHSLAQTMFTNFYLHNPCIIEDRILKAFSINMLKTIDLIRDRVNRASVFEEV